MDRLTDGPGRCWPRASGTLRYGVGTVRCTGLLEWHKRKTLMIMASDEFYMVINRAVKRPYKLQGTIS